MMKYPVGIALFVSMLSSAFAVDGRIYAGAKLGRGNISVDSDFAINGQAIDDNTTTGSLYAGYRSAGGLLAEVSYSTATNDNLFDTYDLSELNLMLGYVLNINRNLRFVPKLGLSQWQLEVAESGLFSIGAPETAEYDGTDFLWSADLELAVSRNMRLNFSYSRGYYEFGEVDTSGFGVIFGF